MGILAWADVTACWLRFEFVSGKKFYWLLEPILNVEAAEVGTIEG